MAISMIGCKWSRPESRNRPLIGQAGFSLVEMAIVLVILGLMLGAMLMPLSTQRDLNDRRETEQLLQEIHDALIGFAAANGRLPCPASNASNNVADPNAATPSCTQEHGFVPARTLGLNGSFDVNNRLMDAWNNPIRYSLTTASGGAYSNNIDISTGNPDYRICSQSGCGGASIQAENVVAVIISRGKDGALATTSPDQLENMDNDSDFATRTPSEGTNTEFDDVLRWISPNILTYGLLRAGQLDEN